ncbi:MAG: sensor histidine kinase [Myxococcota bacterium]
MTRSVLRSIRLRIGLAVFAILTLLLLGLSGFVLTQFQRQAREEVDHLLREDLARLQVLVETIGPAATLRSLPGPGGRRNERFLEILDAEGRRIVASSNVPAAGLGAPPPGSARRGAAIWEAVHPASRKGHARIRIAERQAGDLRLRVARSLNRSQKAYWRLRAQLGWALLVVAALGALAAWGFATRALAPVRAIAARARALGAQAEGELPVLGTGDELDQLVGTLNDLLRRIRDEVARIRRLTADAAHALRTPLTVIRGSLEMQIESGEPRPDPDALAAILEAVDELIRAVNALLRLERVESSGAEAPAALPLDAGEIAGSVVEALDLLARDRGIELSLRRDAGHPVCVRGDAGQLREAIYNLLDNALRHTPKGGRVTLEVAPHPGRVEIEVRDTGPGLAAQDLERVFERFYSEPGPGGGTGLGLPIARAIARRHGGDLVAVAPASPDDGARFVLTLPAEARAPDPGARDL